ncbi:MAG: cell division protein ZapA [Erythrobacter sp.]
MSEVRITVGPKSYTIGCDPGEEDKIARLGTMIDEFYAKLGSARSTSEANNLVFAALFVADALEEANAAKAPSPSESMPGGDTGLAERLEALAERAERMAVALEGGEANA